MTVLETVSKGGIDMWYYSMNVEAFYQPNYLMDYNRYNYYNNWNYWNRNNPSNYNYYNQMPHAVCFMVG
jgi:hypothetical protein